MHEEYTLPMRVQKALYKKDKRAILYHLSKIAALLKFYYWAHQKTGVFLEALDKEYQYN